MTDAENPLPSKQKPPIVVRDVPLGDFLTERQQVWLSSQTFDFQTENPSVYKAVLDAVNKQQTQLREQREAALEVLSLRDASLGSDLQSSTVIKNLLAKRGENHSRAWADMLEDLSGIATECEKMTVAQTTSSIQMFNDIDKCLSHLLNETSFESNFALLEHSDLVELWEETVGRQVGGRGEVITTTVNQLDRIEDVRVHMVQDTLARWFKTFLSIGHLLPADIARLLDSEALAVNKAAVANKTANAKIAIRLWVAHVNKEKRLRGQWEDLVLAWMKAFKKQIETDFLSSVKQNRAKWTQEKDSIVSCWRAELTAANKRRIQHLTDLRLLLPPSCTKTSCYSWHKDLQAVSAELVAINAKYLDKLQSSQEGLSSACLEMVECCKERLVVSCRCSPEEACRFALDHLVPAVDRLQSQHSQEMDSCQEGVSSMLEQQAGETEDLFQCLLGAAHLWEDSHGLLQKAEGGVAEDLKNTRSAHNKGNHQLENTLDLVLDQLRQGPSEEVLQSLMWDAFKKLAHLATTYLAFHHRLLATVQGYPRTVARILEAYSEVICKYFGVDKKPAKKVSQKTDAGRTSKPSTSRPTTRTPQSKVSSEVCEALEEVVNTSAFFINREGLRGNTGSTVFLTQQEPSRPECGIIADCIALHNGQLNGVYKKACQGFLDHLEALKKDKAGEAEAFVAVKSEEFSTELDLRLHLHTPRAARVECDIHHVRAAELLAHKERVASHLSSARNETAAVKAVPNEFASRSMNMSESLAERVSDLESKLSKENHRSGLDALEVRFMERYKEHCAALKRCHESSQACIDSITARVAASTEQFRQAMKLFSEGGNYSNEEVDVFKQKLERVLSRTQAAKQSSSKELKARYEDGRETGERVKDQLLQKLNLYRTEIELYEKVNKSLSKCQVMIKAEVAKSNSQSAAVLAAVESLPRGLASAGPEVAQVSQRLGEVFAAVRARVDYLHCSTRHAGGVVGGEGDPPVVTLSSVSAAQAILEFAATKSKSSSKGYSDKLPADSGRKDASQYKGRQTERKHVTFGAGGGKENSGCFLPAVRGYIKECHIDVSATAEGFYRWKGTRGVLRSDLVEPSFDPCLDRVVGRLQSYRRQAELYRNECVDELREQVRALASGLHRMPADLYRSLISRADHAHSRTKDALTAQYASQIEARLDQHERCVGSLYPSVGHPSQQARRRELEEEWQGHHLAYLSAVSQHSSQLQEAAKKATKSFMEEIVAGTTAVLASLDNTVLLADLIPACGSKAKQTGAIEDVLRDSQAAQPTDSRGSSTISSGRKWRGIALTELCCGDSSLKKKLCSPVPTKRSSTVHELVISNRDSICQEHQHWLEAEVKSIAEQERARLQKEQLLLENWEASVDAVKQLYAVEPSP